MALVVTTYHWDFGDGYSSIEEEPDHKYSRAGTYTVTLTVWTDVGSISVSKNVTVLEPSTRNIEVFTIRRAIEPVQGRGWNEISGEDWVNPKDNYGILLLMDDNDTPRMLIEDQNDDFTWEDATYDRVENLNPEWVDKYYEEDLRSADWRWILSASGTAEYYLDKPDGGNPYIDDPKKILLNDTEVDEGTLGALAAGEWGYGDNDTLGYNTIYVRLSDDTDPDTKTGDWVHAIFYTEIDGEIWEKEIVADPNSEEDECEFGESHYFTRPEHPQNKGNADYDDSGYRLAQEFSLDFYLNGDLTRAYASVREIPEYGDIIFSGQKLEGNRGQFVFKFAASEVHGTGLNHYGIRKPRQGTREQRRTQDWTIETILAIAQLWISRNSFNGLLERVSGNTLVGDVTQTTGPDGFSRSAILLNANLSLLNAANAGVYTVFFWRSTTAPVPTIPALPALTQQGATFDGWQLMYVTGTGLPANLIVTVGTIYDIRIYAGDVTDYMSDIYNDVRYTEEPKQLIPGM